jgi:putative transposase
MPNAKQKELFEKCFRAHNYFYNKAVEVLKKKPRTSLIDMRKIFIPREDEMCYEDLWMKDIPLDTREAAAQKAIDSLKTCFTLLKNKQITHFNLSFRSKKKSKHIFYIAKSALKKDGKIFPKKLKFKEMEEVIDKKGIKKLEEITIDYSNLIPKHKNDKKYLDKSDGIFTISKDKSNKYFIHVIIKPKEKKLESKTNICALDPGVRTFQTMYSQNSVGEFGYDTSKNLYDLYRRENKYKSVMAKYKLSRERKNQFKRRLNKLRTKAKNVVNDLHWKTCDFLTKEYQVILLPVFNSKKMANKANRKISKTTTRLMLGLKHYDFQQKLLYKAKLRGRNVIICKEHYTTKCCGECGNLNDNIGSKKIFSCNDCWLTLDRDTHAARNILIRGLSILFDQASRY